MLLTQVETLHSEISILKQELEIAQAQDELVKKLFNRVEKN